MLEKKLASESVSEEEQVNLLKDLERRETNFMRLKRHKICADDFDLLTIIGRGAFGEVRNMHFLCLLSQNCVIKRSFCETSSINKWYINFCFQCLYLLCYSFLS